MPSIREDCSAVRLSSFWNCASRHQGKPNDCARTGAATARSSRATRRQPRVVSLMRKPQKNLLLKRIRRAVQLYLTGDKFLRRLRQAQKASSVVIAAPTRLSGVEAPD